MARHWAEIDELAGFVGSKGQSAARPFCLHTIRAGSILVDDDIVFRAFAVDQYDLHGLALVHRQRRIDFAVELATDADVDHPAIRNAGA